MSVQTQIDRISGNVSAALSAIADKGVTVPDGSNSDALRELILSIEAGGSASGFAKVATGTIIPSSDTDSITISHGLGQLPDVAILYTKSDIRTSKYFLYSTIYVVISSDTCYWVCSGGTGSTKYGGRSYTWNANPNEETISFLGQIFGYNNSIKTAYYISGIEYRWIAGVFA